MKGENMIKEKERERARLVAKTKRGVITKIYGAQVSHSKAKGRSLPTYDKEWFFNWLMSQPEFHRLFHIWVHSGYNKWLKPSVDRMDENIGYTEYNIELVQWQDNHFKEAQKQSKVVIKLDLEGNILDEYDSISKASKSNKIPSANISRACRKTNVRTAGGYKWKFKTGE